MTQNRDTINHNYDFKKKHLKLSNYNHFTFLNNSFFGFNLLYRTVIRIPPEAYNLLDGIIYNNESAIIQNLDQQNEIPEHWLKTLYDTKFIIDDDFDELSYIKFRYYRNLYANDFLSLVILPTLWCNFDCPYCFEFKKPVSMNENIELALMEWIATNFTSKRNFHIAWFGGEPLLKKNTIIRLTKKLKEFCEDIGAKYESSLTTNGYYFDAEFQKILYELSISNVQITLDGDRDDHDALRKKRNGKGSFDKIFENIVSFCDKDYQCKLTIRVNCGDDNYIHIHELLKRFPENVIKKTNIFFRWIWANKACDYKEFSSKIKGSKPFEGLSQLYKFSSSLGWQTMNPNDRISDGYCEVDYLDFFTIGPDGDIYICSHTFEKSDAIGSILDKKDYIFSDKISAYSRWYTVNPFEDSQCIQCKLLPICSGGCRKARSEGRRECIEEKLSLDLFVKNMIESRLVQKSLIVKGGDKNGRKKGRS